MKFITTTLKFCFILILTATYSVSFNLKASSYLNTLSQESYSEYLLSELKFLEGSPIDTLVLKERITSNQIYETWSVIRSEGLYFKPYYAHIFKYQLANKFPLKHENLKTFCENIEKLNTDLETNTVPINSLTCLNNTYVDFKTSKGAVGTYILFKKVVAGQTLDELCNENCLKERFCKYHQKEIAKSILTIQQLKKSNKVPLFAVDILFSRKMMFYGKFPKKQNPNFIFIPLFNFQDLSSFTDEKPSTNLLKLKEKEKLVEIGIFLIELFSGKNLKGVTFKHFTDVFTTLNKESEGEENDMKAEPYMGVTKEYINGLHNFKAKKISSTPDFNKFDNLLLGSFYEFVFKLAQLDLSSKSQFEDFEAALKHPFVNYSGTQITRSDS